jgi:hypothetical protein
MNTYEGFIVVGDTKSPKKFSSSEMIIRLLGYPRRYKLNTGQTRKNIMLYAWLQASAAK